MRLDLRNVQLAFVDGGYPFVHGFPPLSKPQVQKSIQKTQVKKQ